MHVKKPGTSEALHSQRYKEVPHFQQEKKRKESEVAQSCPNLCDPMDYRPPSSSIHGIFLAQVLEWVAISFFKGSSQPRDWTQVSHIAGRHFTIWATINVHLEQALEFIDCRLPQVVFPVTQSREFSASKQLQMDMPISLIVWAVPVRKLTVPASLHVS